MKFLLILILALLPMNMAAAEEAPSRYYVPPGQFNAVMQVMDLGLANLFGMFGNSTGSFMFEEQAKTLGNMRIAIDTTSLVASNAQSQRDLAGLIDVMQYSEIRFTAPDTVKFEDGKASIKGTLTLHGASKPVTLEVTLNRVGKSPHGGGMWSKEGDALGLSMRGSFKRADFGITDNPEIPSRFGDTITLQLEMQAIKQ